MISQSFIDGMVRRGELLNSYYQWRNEPTDLRELIGKKADSGKLEWHLLPWRECEEVVRVLMKGKEKYGENNWRIVDDMISRYWDAAMRHMTAYRKGEIKDPEFGTPHLAHAMCCLLFMMWKDNESGSIN